MAKAPNQKLKLLYLMKILMEKTDDSHIITMPEILKALESYGVTAERKSIYSDMEYLRVYGIDVIGENGNYHVGSRFFELPELKLLVDSIQSAKFITAKKSHELIKKLESLASEYEAVQLNRQVYVSERVKTDNESIYYNVDKIHTAIGENSRITFRYFRWNVDKEMELRHDGALYDVSPWALTWADENYYMIAYDSREEKIKHFRVDKMLNLTVTYEPREGRECFEGFDMAVYSKKMFGMFGGEEEIVQLECENSLAGVIIDRFGREVSLMKTDDAHFVARVRVAVSRQFIAWVISLGAGARIIGPEPVVEQVKKEVARLAEQYK